MYPGLNKDPVGADTRLASAAELAGNNTLHGSVDVCIVKHDEWCVASSLNRDPDTSVS
jgi:hypothetical protein